MILLLNLNKKKEAFKASIKRNAEIGSPWRLPLSRLKNFVVMPPFTTQDSRFLIRIWIHFRKRPSKPCFCKTADKKEWSTESRAFLITTLTRNPFLFKMLVVSSTSYIILPLSLIYLLFTYAAWLDEIRSGNMSFYSVANAFEINFRSVFEVIVIDFMNDAGLYCIIRRTVFNVYICLDHSWRYKQNQIERLDEKPRRQKIGFVKF